MDSNCTGMGGDGTEILSPCRSLTETSNVNKRSRRVSSQRTAYMTYELCKRPMPGAASQIAELVRLSKRGRLTSNIKFRSGG